MYKLSEGAITKILSGTDVDKPLLQILGHKRLGGPGKGERYRLLVSDGQMINSFTMLATQLNTMITNNILSEFSICEVSKYATSLVNSSGKPKKVMVILNLEVKVPGEEIGHRIGNPTNMDADADSKFLQLAQPAQSAEPPVEKKNNTVKKNTASSSSIPDITTTPIIALSPYQNRWVIKARVTTKSDIRTWSNSRGEGKLFNIDLVDESGEIRCTAFQEACNKHYDSIEPGKVYYISKGNLKPANKQYSNLKNDYEMTLNVDSEIILCHDNEDEIPTLQFNFSPISEIEKMQKNEFLDILGVVKSCESLQTITARNSGKEMKKRDVYLVDDSNTMVTLTLWGKQAEEFDGSNNPIIAIKRARIGEFNGGKNLSTLNSSVIEIDPDIPAAHRLRGWFNTSGCNEEAKVISKSFGGGGGIIGPMITFKDARDMELGFKGIDTYTVKATVNMIRIENALYKACPTETCKKKLQTQGNDEYRCEKCEKDYPNFKYRLLASLSLSDWTDNQWATAFNEEAEKILAITAQELGELQENNNQAFLEKFGDATFKSFIFKLRVKLQVFSDESRLKATCASVSPMDFKLYNAHLIKQIKELVGIAKA